MNKETGDKVLESEMIVPNKHTMLIYNLVMYVVRRDIFYSMMVLYEIIDANIKSLARIETEDQFGSQTQYLTKDYKPDISNCKKMITDACTELSNFQTKKLKKYIDENISTVQFPGNKAEDNKAVPNERQKIIEKFKEEKKFYQDMLEKNFLVDFVTIVNTIIDQLKILIEIAHNLGNQGEEDLLRQISVDIQLDRDWSWLKTANDIKNFDIGSFVDELSKLATKYEKKKLITNRVEEQQKLSMKKLREEEKTKLKGLINFLEHLENKQNNELELLESHKKKLRELEIARMKEEKKEEEKKKLNMHTKLRAAWGSHFQFLWNKYNEQRLVEKNYVDKNADDQLTHILEGLNRRGPNGYRVRDIGYDSFVNLLTYVCSGDFYENL